MKPDLPQLHAYATAMSGKEPTLLTHLRKETCKRVTGAQMLSSVLQGHILALLAKLVQPRSILEIGTYTGYSALCLAEGLASDGVLHTIERNSEVKEISQKYFIKAGKAHQIVCHRGLAAEIIPTIQETFNLIFMDADKRNYSLYYDQVVGKLQAGGLMIVDNVLWKMKVLDKDALVNDVRAQLMTDFTIKIRADRRMEQVLLPLCDGLLVGIKKARK